MLRKSKVFICLVMFFGMIFCPALEMKAGDGFEFMYKTEQKKVPCISYLDTRPVIEIKELTYVEDPTEEEIAEEIRFGEMELIAQLVMAEAGNQDLMGKRYVVDVVLNRVDSDDFPNTVEEVIFQENQFSVINNGTFDEAGWTVTEECYEAVKLEYEERLNYDVLYFSRGPSKYASNHFKHQDHWFGW